MSNERLPRLDADPQAPPELLRALRALAEEAPSHSQLARVAEKLGPLLDAPPPPGTGLAGWLRGAAGKGLAARLTIAALAIGSTLALLPWRIRSPRQDSARPAVPAPAQDRHAPGVPEEEPRAVLAEASTASPVMATAPAPREPKPRAPRPVRRHVARGPAMPTSVLTSAPGRSATASQESPTQQVVDSGPVAPQAKPARAQPKNEVELLVEARRLLGAQPALALAVLDEHAVRFSAGLLAPEREVLAIEALRKLGQRAAAARRLDAFRSRYPDSMHLPRLTRPLKPLEK